MPPEKDIVKYIKVQAHARRGVPGERDNAKAILSKMEAEYPGIKMAAAQYERRQQAGVSPPRNPWPSGSPFNPRSGAAPPRPAGHGARAAGLSFDELFGYGQAFVNGFAEFAETIGNVTAGRGLGEHAQVSAKIGKTGSLLLQIKLPAAALEATEHLNTMQMQGFREALHSKLDELLDEVFEGD